MHAAHHLPVSPGHEAPCFPAARCFFSFFFLPFSSSRAFFALAAVAQDDDSDDLPVVMGRPAPSTTFRPVTMGMPAPTTTTRPVAMGLPAFTTRPVAMGLPAFTTRRPVVMGRPAPSTRPVAVGLPPIMGKPAPRQCPVPPCAMPMCMDGFRIEGLGVGAEFSFDGQTCRSISCPRCVPEATCTDIARRCAAPKCPVGQELFTPRTPFGCCCVILTWSFKRRLFAPIAAPESRARSPRVLRAARACRARSPSRRASRVRVPCLARASPEASW